MKSTVTVVKNDEVPVTWTVEAHDIDDDGGSDLTIFSGPDAGARAHEYAVWKYQQAVVEREYA